MVCSGDAAVSVVSSLLSHFSAHISLTSASLQRPALIGSSSSAAVCLDLLFVGLMSGTLLPRRPSMH